MHQRRVAARVRGAELANRGNGKNLRGYMRRISLLSSSRSAIAPARSMACDVTLVEQSEGSTVDIIRTALCHPDSLRCQRSRVSRTLLKVSEDY